MQILHAQLQRFKLGLIALLCVLGLATLASPIVSAAPEGSRAQVCQGIGDLGGGDADCDSESQPGTGLNSVIATAVRLLSYAAGIIAVMMLIVSGLNYITASGDPNSISHAKNTLIYALVGLVVVAMAQFIVRYVLGEAG